MTSWPSSCRVLTTLRSGMRATSNGEEDRGADSRVSGRISEFDADHPRSSAGRVSPAGGPGTRAPMLPRGWWSGLCAVARGRRAHGPDPRWRGLRHRGATSRQHLNYAPPVQAAISRQVRPPSVECNSLPALDRDPAVRGVHELDGPRQAQDQWRLACTRPTRGRRRWCGHKRTKSGSRTGPYSRGQPALRPRAVRGLSREAGTNGRVEGQ